MRDFWQALAQETNMHSWSMSAAMLGRAGGFKALHPHNPCHRVLRRFSTLRRGVLHFASMRDFGQALAQETTLGFWSLEHESSNVWVGGRVESAGSSYKHVTGAATL